MNNDKPHEQQESYGMASFARFTGGAGSFFGSGVKHMAGVSLEINRASVKHDLGQDWYMPGDHLIRVEMSESQFAQLISSMNSAAVPCTITRVFKRNLANFSDESIKHTPESNVRAKLSKDFADQFKLLSRDLDALIAQAAALQTKPHIGKADREQFTKIAEGLKAQISSAMPFYQTQFTESMENIVQDAKANIESFVQQTVKRLGVDVIKTKLAASGILLELGPGEAKTIQPK